MDYPFPTRTLTAADFPDLANYLQSFSPATRERFGPHPYDLGGIQSFFSQREDLHGFISHSPAGQIIGYALIKEGLLPSDQSRFEGYGQVLPAKECCTYAPSVADEWQGKRVGSGLFETVKRWAVGNGRKHIVLWGGVQEDNHKAVNFYSKHGFQEVGRFEYHGGNLDMVCPLS